MLRKYNLEILVNAKILYFLMVLAMQRNGGHLYGGVFSTNKVFRWKTKITGSTNSPSGGQNRCGGGGISFHGKPEAFHFTKGEVFDFTLCEAKNFTLFPQKEFHKKDCLPNRGGCPRAKRDILPRAKMCSVKGREKSPKNPVQNPPKNL